MIYPSIRIEGAILSPDILDRLDDAAGQRPADFGLETGTKVKDEIARAWADAQDYWRIFQRKLETLRPDSPATTETRQQWVTPLLGLLGYQLEYQAKGVELNGKTYAISHRVTNRGQTPIHIIGAREVAGLDRKPERTHIGAPRMSAHALVQEYLNLHDELYGIVTNGRVLRLLRDSSRLIKLSYLEFDLDRIFGDGLFADFAILYRLLHATKLPQTIDASSTCWLERYHQDSIEQGSRIREGLRKAVTEALEILGTGFLAHPDNKALCQQIADGQIKTDVYFNHLLRVVYRLLFLMVIEERGLVFPKGTPSRNRDLYYRHYSVQRLRRLAITRGLKVERFHDAWLALLATFKIFEHPEQAAAFGATVLGGQLFHPESLGPLADCRISNAALFSALDRLCYFDDPQTGQRTPVNFGALATEEFGSVYESLLELHPITETTPTPYFGFKQAAGNERKTSGSYYTPASLVDCLLDSALDPVLDERIRSFSKLGYKSANDAVLALKVCDPACGSGHFLIAAAQRIARRLAMLRAGDEEPAPDVLRHTLREVIGHCIHGVDINPMSVELCKLGLWLEAVEPGKPLTFLDHHIKCGNSLLGATPQAIRDGIPDDAYKPIAGDTREAATWMKKLNQAARAGQGGFDFNHAEPWNRLGNLPAAIVQLENLDDDTPEALEKKEKLYRDIIQNSSYDNAKLLHDAWCAAFVWPKHSTDYGSELTTGHLRAIEHNPYSVATRLKEQVRTLAGHYHFFHWHLEFPAVFGAEGEGGFDVMLGNPPWDVYQPEEEKFFAATEPSVLNAKTATERKKKIGNLKGSNPMVWSKWEDYCELILRSRHFIGTSGRYPLTSYGKTNLYSSFTELGLALVSPNGLLGVVLPTGMATDEPNKYFMQALFKRNLLVSLFDFENKGIFPSVHSSFKFCLFTTRSARVVTDIGHGAVDAAEFVFFAHSVDELHNSERRFTLSADDIALLNPNTCTCPIFRCRHDAELTKVIYLRVPSFQVESKPDGDPWSMQLARLFMMDSDSGEFVSAGTSTEAGSLNRLYESKLMHQFDHRFATFEGVPFEKLTGGQALEMLDKAPSKLVVTRFYVPTETTEKRYSRSEWKASWALSLRDITNVTNERTTITCFIPREAAANNLPLILSDRGALDTACLCAALNSFVLDYVARQKVGGTHINLYLLQQFPVFPPATYALCCTWSGNGQNLRDWLVPRVLELTYTAWDMEPFAHDCGFDGPPFRWDEARRFQLRCELDAAFFHLYGIARDDVGYIMDTFPIVKRKDEAQYGSYRTKDTILALYDALAEAQRTGQSFVSSLVPPPADPSCCHLPHAVVLKSLSLADLTSLPDAEWERPGTDQANEEAVVLAAILKAIGGPMPIRDIRLAALIAMRPRLLTPSLSAAEAAQWKRLIGAEAEPLAASITALQPPADHAWGNAVRGLLGRGRLVEDFAAQTWARGQGLDSIITDGWPEGRVGMVLRVLSERGTDKVAESVPEALREWVNVRAA